MAYRIAMMAGAGIIATIGTTMGWPIAFGGSALVLALFSAYHLRYLPHTEAASLPLALLLPKPQAGRLLRLAIVAALGIVVLCLLTQAITRQGLLPRQRFLLNIDLAALISILLIIALLVIGFKRRNIKKWLQHKGNAFFSEAFFSFMDRDKIGPILTFIVLIRTGEYMLSSMVAPFMVDLGIKQHYGWISGGIGLPFSIIGAMLGGWLISKSSFKKMIWPYYLPRTSPIWPICF